MDHAHSSLLTSFPSSLKGPSFHLKGKFLFRSTASQVFINFLAELLMFLRQNLNSGDLQLCYMQRNAKLNQCLLAMHAHHLCKFVLFRDNYYCDH